MALSALAGKPAPKEILVDPLQLEYQTTQRQFAVDARRGDLDNGYRVRQAVGDLIDVYSFTAAPSRVRADNGNVACIGMR